MIVDNYCVGILTFSKRKKYIENLLNQIRLDSEIPVYLCINCDYNQPFDPKYRDFILKLCLKHKNVYPLFYLKFRGLSKAWNDMVINACYDNMIIMNDDSTIQSGFFDEIVNQYEHLYENEPKQILKINNGWACFIVNKEYLTSVTFFNEKYIGIGFEDAEFVRRHGEFPGYVTEKFIDLASELESLNSFPKNENITMQSEKSYTSINVEIFQSNSGDYQNPKPYEQFYVENYNKIFGEL
jgi:hypothetical protein